MQKLELRQAVTQTLGEEIHRGRDEFAAGKGFGVGIHDNAMFLIPGQSAER